MTPDHVRLLFYVGLSLIGIALYGWRLWQAWKWRKYRLTWRPGRYKP